MGCKGVKYLLYISWKNKISLRCKKNNTFLYQVFQLLYRPCAAEDFRWFSQKAQNQGNSQSVFKETVGIIDIFHMSKGKKLQDL